jgi:hypothetical protein
MINSKKMKNQFSIHDAQIHATYLSSQIIGKVMLYSHQTLPSCFILIDHNRPFIPLTTSDVVVPVHPKKHDMVRVSGDDVWLAHVQTVDTKLRTCRVHFFIKDKNHTSLYKKERGRIETVHWASIVGLASVLC